MDAKRKKEITSCDRENGIQATNGNVKMNAKQQCSWDRLNILQWVKIFLNMPEVCHLPKLNRIQQNSAKIKSGWIRILQSANIDNCT